MHSRFWMGLAAALLAACGGGGSANISIGTMPAGGSFHGVWQSPQYGEMHLCQTGAQVHGMYEKDERSGKIQGSIQGDVMRFSWEEERELVAGRPTTTRGRGYFRIVQGGDDDWYFKGEWGVDDKETGGGEWNGVRLRNREPEKCMASTTTGDEDSSYDDDSYDDYGDDSDSYDDSGSDDIL